MNGNQQTCDLCGTSGPEVQTGFLRVVRQRITPGLITTRWVNLQCQCCDRCVRKARQIKQRRYLVVAAMVAWLFLAPCLLAPLGLLLGEKGSPRNLAIILGGLVVVVAGFLAGPLYLRSFNRRRTAQLLGPVIDAELRERAGIGSWGLRSEVLIDRVLPRGESAVPLLPRR